MKRIDIIQELRSYAHPRDYHNFLVWPTKSLEALLKWYQDGNKVGPKDTLVAILYRIKDEAPVKRPEGLKRVMTFKSI